MFAPLLTSAAHALLELLVSGNRVVLHDRVSNANRRQSSKLNRFRHHISRESHRADIAFLHHVLRIILGLDTSLVTKGCRVAVCIRRFGISERGNSPLCNSRATHCWITASTGLSNRKWIASRTAPCRCKSITRDRHT